MTGLGETGKRISGVLAGIPVCHSHILAGEGVEVGKDRL